MRLALLLLTLTITGCAKQESETWVCAGRPDLVVTPSEDAVAITARDGTLTLSKIETASGVIYAGAGVEWIPRGDQALFTRDGQAVSCQKLRTRH